MRPSDEELRADAAWNDQQERYRLAALIVGVVMLVALVAWSIGRGS